MRTLTFRLLSLSLPMMLLAGCSGGADDANAGPKPGSVDDDKQYEPGPRGSARPDSVPASAIDCTAGNGTLNGRFVAPNGNTPIAGAFVYVASGDCWAGTDKDGKFSVKGLPMTETPVHAEKGLFRSEGAAAPGSSTLSLQVDPSTVPLAYVAGSFDTVQFVLERLGFTPDRIDEDSLSSDVLADYAAVFLNCGLNEIPAEDPDVQQALKGYVEGGGVLYASDWAEIYVKEAFPGKVNFLGLDPRVGEMGTHEAKVLDEGLARALGKSTATITFDAPIWAVIDSVPASTRVLVSGPATIGDGTTLPDRPYMVQFEAGKGRVTYTSFHNEAQTTGDMDTLLEQLLFQL